jgi:hypothetical protein
VIASECEMPDGLHVAAEVVHVEVLDGSDDESGKVIVTDLVNRATPLLRYAIGDLSTMKFGVGPEQLDELTFNIVKDSKLLQRKPAGACRSGYEVFWTAHEAQRCLRKENPHDRSR